MEKGMSVEERIKRAEDIYNRRNGVYTRSVSNSEKNCKIAKKKKAKRLLMQIFVCLLIYIIFYAVNNRNYIFSEDFRNSVNIFLEKANASEIYKKAKSFIIDFFNDEEKTEENKIEENTTKDEILDETKDDEKKNEGEPKKEEKQSQEKNKEDKNIGGATEKTENISKNKDEKLTEQQIMEKEAKEIKKSISFIKPISRKNKLKFWMEKSYHKHGSNIPYWS